MERGRSNTTALLIEYATHLQEQVKKLSCLAGLRLKRLSWAGWALEGLPRSWLVPGHRSEVDVTPDETKRCIPTPIISDRSMTPQKEPSEPHLETQPQHATLRSTHLMHAGTLSLAYTATKSHFLQDVVLCSGRARYVPKSLDRISRVPVGVLESPTQK